MPSTIFSRTCSGFDATSRLLRDRRRAPRRPARPRHLVAREVVGRLAKEMCIASSRASSASPPAELDQHADLVRGRMDVAGEHLARRRLEALGAATTMFSPSLRDRARRARPRASPPRPGRLPRRASSTRWANDRNSSFFETGSVSQPTRDHRADAASPSSGARPCPRSSRGGALARLRHPFSRRSLRAASRSPPVSSSARLQSIIPAPVCSRSSLTRLAEISVTVPTPSARGLGRRRLAAAGGSPRPRRLGARGGGSRSARLRRSATASARPARLRGSARRRLGASARPRPSPRRSPCSCPAAIASAIARTIRLQRADRVVVARDDVVGLVRDRSSCRRGRPPACRGAAPRARRAPPCAGRR